jgi:simple sugar transport system ATP-binding protein
LRKLQAEGTSILYISHKLDEIRALCQAATVLRLGKVVGRCDPTQKSASELAEMMIGSNLHRPSRPAQEVGPVALEVKNLSLPSLSAFGTPLKDISMTVHKGQIFGIGGVAGNGQDELLAALSGEMQAPRAAITLHGDAIGHLGPTERRKRSVMAAPEERMGHAAVPAMSLTENAALTGMQPKDLATRGMIDWGKARDFAAEIIARFDVRTPGTQTAASALSGGNLQKFVIGREVMQNPEVLIVNQPTWGVDAHAAATIRQALMDLASAGTAVIVISQDLDELMEVSDVFAALNEGRLSAARPAAGLSIEEIGLMMGGAHDLEVAHVAG